MEARAPPYRRRTLAPFRYERGLPIDRQGSMKPSPGMWGTPNKRVATACPVRTGAVPRLIAASGWQMAEGRTPLAVVALVSALIGVVSALVPGRRATRVDPM